MSNEQSKSTHAQEEDMLQEALYHIQEDDFEEEDHDEQSLSRDAAAATAGSAFKQPQRQGNASRTQLSTAGGAAADSSFQGDEQLEQGFEELMKQLQQPDMRSILEQTTSEAKNANIADGQGGSSFDAAPTAEADDADQSVQHAMEMLQKLAASDTDQEGASAMGDEAMNEIMKEFEEMGKKDDFQSVVDNMMKQLLSKDIMYEPVVEITKRFPGWLASHKDGLSREEYEKYGIMYQQFQKLCDVYSTEPDNYPKLMEIIQDLQECGQPPPEIIKELAPGLEMGQDGMPNLPNMGAGIPNMGLAVSAERHDNCSQRLLVPERYPLEPGTAPPEDIPQELTWAFTRCGTIPVESLLIDDSREGKGTHLVYRNQEIRQQIEEATKLLYHIPENLLPSLVANEAMLFLIQALRKHKEIFHGAKVAVYGSTSPRIETLVLALNASKVITIEYNNLTYEHERIETITKPEFDRLRESPDEKHHIEHDIALSISSFDHDGLGRYGDPIAPDGDLLAMDEAWATLRSNGTTFLTVPIGRDSLVWNMHRRYGPIRLPLLLQGWELVEKYGWEERRYNAPAPMMKSYEPVIVLRKNDTKVETSVNEDQDIPMETEL